MPYSYPDNVPRPAKNWTEDEKRKCVKAANAVLSGGGADEDAIFACIHVAGKTKHPGGKETTMSLRIGDAVRLRRIVNNPIVNKVGNDIGRIEKERNGTFDVLFDGGNFKGTVRGVPAGMLVPAGVAKTRAIDPALGKLVSAVSARLEKRGAKHSKDDTEHLQGAHDHLAKMVDYAHCEKAAGNPPPEEEAPEQEEDLRYGPMGQRGEKVAKRGAKHSKETMGYLKTAHDAVVKAGAICKGY